MDILSIALIIFVTLETSNVCILYFKPESKLGNGVAVFDHFEKSKEDKELHEFIKYLVYWVAGTKLIFIALLIVIIFTGTPTVKFLSVLVLILSILSFYLKLYPIIKNLDNKGYITPNGYSKTLFMMITSFISVFILAIVFYII